VLIFIVGHPLCEQLVFEFRDWSVICFYAGDSESTIVSKAHTVRSLVEAEDGRLMPIGNRSEEKNNVISDHKSRRPVENNEVVCILSAWKLHAGNVRKSAFQKEL